MEIELPDFSINPNSVRNLNKLVWRQPILTLSVSDVLLVLALSSGRVGDLGDELPLDGVLGGQVTIIAALSLTTNL